MVSIGALVTTFSIVAGAVYVQAAIISSDRDAELEASVPEPSAPPLSTVTSGLSGLPAAPAVTTPNLARANEAKPALDSSADFALNCNPGSPVQSGTLAPATSCRVDSYSGFNGRVDLSCAQTPPNLSCQFSPASVQPPANGSAGFQLLIVSDAAAPGNYVFEVVGQSGGRTNRSSFPFSISAPPTRDAIPTLPGISNSIPFPNPAPLPSPIPQLPTFNLACTLAGPQNVIDKLLWSLNQGSKGTIKCILTPNNGFAEKVTFTVANLSDQIVGATFDPPVLAPSAAGSSFVDLNFELGQLEKGKEYVFDVAASSGEQTLIRRVVLTITE
ncbi:MAG: hypothetical protein ACT4OM_02255 [Actinomycetota bacterium]